MFVTSKICLSKSYTLLYSAQITYSDQHTLIGEKYIRSSVILLLPLFAWFVIVYWLVVPKCQILSALDNSFWYNNH